MSETEESPAQRQARLRREKREAKIKVGGSDRLDKIAKLSGRTPEMMRKDSPSPSPSSAPAPPAQTPPAMAQSFDPSDMRAQEEFIRSMLRAQEPQQGQDGEPQQQQQQQQQVPEDPMMKLLSTLAGGEANTDPNNPAGLPFTLEDIQAATGMPSWATKLLLGGKGKASPAAEEEKTTRVWNMIHIVFSTLAGFYMLYMLGDATATFGKNPPPPATVWNPFMLFVLGELLVHGSRILIKAPARTGRGIEWLQIGKDVNRDGSIILFMLGAANWWKGAAS